MTNLLYALLIIISGGLTNNSSEYSNSKEAQFEQVHNKDGVYAKDNNGDDNDDDEDENPDED